PPRPTLPTPPLFPYQTLFRSRNAQTFPLPDGMSGSDIPLAAGAQRQHRRLAARRIDQPIRHQRRRNDPVVRSLLRIQPCCPPDLDRKSTRLNSSHVSISYAVF